MDYGCQRFIALKNMDIIESHRMTDWPRFSEQTTFGSAAVSQRQV